MNKVVTLIFINLLFFSALRAQEDKKMWYEGRISWQDFKTMEKDHGIFAMKYMLGYNSEEITTGDTVVSRITAICYIDKGHSWVDPAFKTEDYLRYNQAIFDLVELYRRALQFNLDRIKSTGEVEDVFNKINNLCDVEVEKLKAESNGGSDSKVLQKWEVLIAARLNKTEDKIPQVTRRGIGYATNFGLGTGIYVGSVGHYFNPTFDLIFGFDISYHKSFLFLNGNLGWNTVRNDFGEAEKWVKSQKANFALWEASLGYAIIDRSKWRVTPFLGYGHSGMSVRNKLNRDVSFTLSDNNYVFGINADYKLRKKLNLIPGRFIQHEFFETNIRTRLTVGKVDYDNDLNGYIVNFTIGICGFGNGIKIK